jgi:hypothetical protein
MSSTTCRWTTPMSSMSCLLLELSGSSEPKSLLCSATCTSSEISGARASRSLTIISRSS